MLVAVSLAVAAALLGALYAAWRPPGPLLRSAVQHFAAGLIFAAAAAEILPDALAQGHALPVAVGGAIGIGAMLALRAVGQRARGPVGLVTMVAVDVLIDGLVLGIAFAAGERAGLVLSIALTVEILFLGLAVATAFPATTPKPRVIGATVAVALLLPLGALLGAPASRLPPSILTGVFAFGLIALLYLVTEELLVEAHETEDRPWATALFFVGFLFLIVLEESLPAAAKG